MKAMTFWRCISVVFPSDIWNSKLTFSCANSMLYTNLWLWKSKNDLFTQFLFQFTAIFISFSIPVMTLSFGFYAVFFFAPPAWEKERFLCMALFDFCISVWVSTKRHTHTTDFDRMLRNVLNILDHNWKLQICTSILFHRSTRRARVSQGDFQNKIFQVGGNAFWMEGMQWIFICIEQKRKLQAPSKESVVELSSRIDGTKAYFEELAKAWTGSARTFPVWISFVFSLEYISFLLVLLFSYST